jgi:hypothetical protein
MTEPITPIAIHGVEAYLSLQHVKTLLDAGIFTDEGLQSPFIRPSITQMLIELSDTLQKANKAGRRVSFRDDVFDGGANWDVTDLISNCRNAACHVSSGKHQFNQNKFTFNMAIGYSPNAFHLNGTTIGCEYADDAAVFWGGMKLFLKRNLLRAYDEAQLIFPDLWSSR